MRNTRLRGGAVPDEEMGYHLYADVLHDFKGYADKLYNIGSRLNKSVDEDDVVTYFTKGKGLESIENGTTRLANKKLFTLAETTDTFQGQLIPLLYVAGNQAMGLVQDAGHYITEQLGAQNVLTFGSIIDPAPKPVSPKKNPIWFQPRVNTVDIRLSQFGFDPQVVEKITISKLTSGTVAATLTLGNGTVFDAVSTKPATDKLTAKPINNTTKEVAGFFTSIDKAEELALQTGNRGNTYLFYVGKTLGDVMLVASAMSTFNNGGTRITNPYTGVGQAATTGRWLTWGGNVEVTETPQILVLKTGDRLNHIRAFIKNVPTILEQQAKAGRNSAIRYEFIPTDVDEARIRRLVASGYPAMIKTADERYNELINNLSQCVENGRLKAGRSTFTDVDTITTPRGLEAAGRMILKICNDLVTLRTKVLDILKAKQAAPPGETLQVLYANYNIDAELSQRLIPATTEVFNAKKKAINIAIVVTRVNTVGIPAVSIRLWNAFKALNNIQPETDPYELVKNTDINKFFFEKIKKVPERDTGDITTVDDEATIPDVDDVRALVNNIIRPRGTGRGGNKRMRDNPTGQTTLMDVDLADTIENAKRKTQDREGIPADQERLIFTGEPTRDEDTSIDMLSYLQSGALRESAPLIDGFCTYMKDHRVLSPYEQLNNVYRIINQTETTNLVDTAVQETLMNEFDTVKKMYEFTPPLSTRTRQMVKANALYNAFVSSINKINSASMGAYEEDNTTKANDTYIFFTKLEEEFLKYLPGASGGQRTRRNKTKK
jgi:hypothetical protein